ncbi:MAG: ATP-binding cassette domain-containing protein [Burkholderiales bacterium]|nr:ATP-binding cassette domain-containing protein [Burkholderiales bacterium]
MTLLEARGLEVRYGGIRAVRGHRPRRRRRRARLPDRRQRRRKVVDASRRSAASSRAQGASATRAKTSARRPPSSFRARGVVMVPEGRGIFPRLTVEENLAMGAYARTDPGIAEDLERQYAMFPRLAERRRQTAGTLSGGEQQMLAIARALMARPRLLLLDEPSMGLAPMLVAKIFDIGARDRLRLAGRHDSPRRAERAGLRSRSRTAADAMESGAIALSGEARALLADPRVRAAYLGEGAG